MRGKAETHYFESTGFTPYYFAHVLFNIVRQPGAYARKLEDILGDGATESLCRPFDRFSNLHILIEDVLRDLFFEADEGPDTIAYDFLKHIDRLDLVPDPEDIDMVAEAMDDQGVSRAFDSLVDEVFQVLFRDVVFLQRFNAMTSHYIRRYGENTRDDRFTRLGRLRRIDVPQYVKDVVFHRDQGECRSCKKAIDRVLSAQDRERYDHIHPLALHGANDVSNIQLLCPPCNSEKSGEETGVSRVYSLLYPRG